MMDSARTVAHLTVIPRRSIDFVGRSVAVEVASEFQSLANYVTILRAVNPTRKILVDRAAHGRDIARLTSSAVRDPGSAANATWAERYVSAGFALSRDVDALRDSRLQTFLPTVVALDPTYTAELMAEVAAYEEDTMLRRHRQRGSDDESAGFPSGGSRYDMALDPVSWLRAFRFAGSMAREFPIGSLLDAASSGYLYDVVGATPTTGSTGVLFNARNMGRPLNGTPVDISDVLFPSGKADDLEAMRRFRSVLSLVDFLCIHPKLSAILQSDKAEIVDKDPKVRYESAMYVARLMRFLSLQPAMLYAAVLHDLLKNPVVRESISELAMDFYTSGTYLAFAQRAETIRLAPAARHVFSDVTSGMGITRFGEHAVLRLPMLLQNSVFTSLDDVGRGLAYAAATTRPAGELPIGSVGSASNAASRFATVSAISSFIRDFMIYTGTEQEWSAHMEPAAVALGFEKPTPAPTVDYLNPEVVMSDGWASSAPVTYHTATRGYAVTPFFMRNGGPAKVAVTTDGDLKGDEGMRVLGLETAVARVDLLSQAFSPEELAAIAKTGVFALPDSRPVLWLVRRAAHMAYYTDEVRLTLRGRLPMALFNGDLDATRIQHTTFEAFAYDLGMAPQALAMLLTARRRRSSEAVGQDPQVSRVLNMFFTQLSGGKKGDAEVADGEGMQSIFEGVDTYGLPARLRFAHPDYFISARSAAMMGASMVALQPMGSPALDLMTRDLVTSVTRKLRTFATIVAEPLHPHVHASALRDTVQLDSLVAGSWGVVFDKPSV